MSTLPPPNPPEAQTEEATFHSQAANIEANIRNEIDTRPIMVTHQVTTEVQGILGPIAPVLAQILALVERLDGRDQTLSKCVALLNGRIFKQDRHDSGNTSLENEILEMKTRVNEQRSTADKLNRKLDTLVGSSNVPKAWAVNMENLLYQMKKLRKERDDQLAVKLDAVLEILKSGVRDSEEQRLGMA